MPTHSPEPVPGRDNATGAAIQVLAGGRLLWPRISLCRARERAWCGRWWQAHTDTDLAKVAVERKAHEALCGPGIIAAAGLGAAP